MKTEKRTLPTDLETLMPLLIGAWRRLHKLSGPPDKLQTREFRSVVEAVKVLQERSKEGSSFEGSSLIGTDYLADPQLLGAYLLYQWVLHYQEGLSLLGELPSTPKRVLDVCSGAAPFAFAALRHGASEVIATDQNSRALQLGAEICGRYGMALSVRPWNCLKEAWPLNGTFDLIIVAHCLEELFPSTQKGWQAKQEQFLGSLIAHLSVEGHLLLVDSSYPESNRRLLQVRDLLVANGVPVQAPCIWRGECPALKTANSPCYAQREFEKPYLVKEIQRAASINLSSLKMSYVLFRHPQAGWPQTGEKKLYRVISPPVDSFNGKRFYLCGSDGKKQLGSHLETHPAESRAFDYLRRGELISFEHALETSHGLEIIKGTKMQVEAACGKPVPAS